MILPVVPFSERISEFYLRIAGQEARRIVAAADVAWRAAARACAELDDPVRAARVLGWGDVLDAAASPDAEFRPRRPDVLRTLPGQLTAGHEPGIPFWLAALFDCRVVSIELEREAADQHAARFVVLLASPPHDAEIGAIRRVVRWLSPAHAMVDERSVRCAVSHPSSTCAPPQDDPMHLMPTLVPGGPVDQPGLQRAIERLLENLHAPPGAMELTGPDALRLECSPQGDLHICHVRMKLASGLRLAAADLHFALPSVGRRASLPIYLRAAPASHPIEDGSVVEVPGARLVVSQEAESDALLIGNWTPQGFVAAIVAADRLDSHPPLTEWFALVQAQLQAMQQVSDRIVGRLSAWQTGQLRWMHWTAAVVGRLAEARLQEASGSPARWLEQLQRLLEATTGLARQAAANNDHDLVELLAASQSDRVPSWPREGTLAAQCAGALRTLTSLLEWWQRLADCFGLGERLPAVLFQDGRLYRQVGRIDLLGASRGAGTRYSLDLQLDRRSALALRSQGARSLGDVVVRWKDGELLTGGGAEPFHWLAGQAIERAVIETHGAAEVVEGVVYAPWVRRVRR